MSDPNTALPVVEDTLLCIQHKEMIACASISQVSDPNTALPVVEERYMAATALLATSSCSMRDESDSENSLEHTEAESALLRSMVAVPLGR